MENVSAFHGTIMCASENSICSDGATFISICNSKLKSARTLSDWAKDSESGPSTIDMIELQKRGALVNDGVYLFLHPKMN